MEEADRLHIDSDPVDDPHELSENNAGNVPQNQNNNVHTNNNNDNNNATTNAKESYASVVPFSALVELCERSSKVRVRERTGSRTELQTRKLQTHT